MPFSSIYSFVISITFIMGTIKKNIIKRFHKFGLVEELDYKVNSKTIVLYNWKAKKLMKSNFQITPPTVGKG